MGERSFEEIHKYLHIKPELPQYEPLAASEALKKISLYISTALNLGVYSFIATDRSVARHIVGFERVIDGLAYQVLIHTSLSVGLNVRKAVGIVPVVSYLHNLDKITDALKDLAYLTLTGYSPSKEVASYYNYVTDVLTAKVKGKYVEGKTINEISEEYAVDIIAMLRSGEWLVPPPPDLRVEVGDRLYVNGFKENVIEFLEGLGIKKIEHLKPPQEVEDIIRGIDSFADMVYLLNDLAHYQLRAQDPGLVEEVFEMEIFVDSLRLKLSESLLKSPLSDGDKFALLTLVTRLEDIADAVTDSIALPTRDEYREVLSKIIESGVDVAKSVKVKKPVKVDTLIKEIDDFDAKVLAIRRGREWIAVTPFNSSRLSVSEGDFILMMFPAVLEDELMQKLKSLGII